MCRADKDSTQKDIQLQLQQNVILQLHAKHFKCSLLKHLEVHESLSICHHKYFVVVCVGEGKRNQKDKLTFVVPL